METKIMKFKTKNTFINQIHTTNTEKTTIYKLIILIFKLILLTLGKQTDLFTGSLY